MTTADAAIPEAHTGELLSALDDAARLLELRTSQLEALAIAIVERDDARMEALLGEIHTAGERQAEVDLRLKAVRAALAGDLGCPPGRVKLESLVGALDGPRRFEIAARRRQVADLIERFRLRHLQTSVLLVECSRINRLLLEAVFPHSRPVETYGSGGRQRWWPDTGLVDAER